MAAPAIGLRTGFNPGTAAHVDWSHPLAAGLVGFWVASGSRMHNLVNPTDSLVPGGGTLAFNPSAFGYAIGNTSADVTGAPGHILSTPSTRLTSLTGPVTMMWAGALLGTFAGTNRRLFSMEYNNANTAQFIAYGLYRSTTTAITAAVAATSFLASGAVTTPTIGSGVAFLTYDKANVRAWWNGTPGTNTVATGNVSYGTGPRMIMGCPELSGTSVGNNAAASGLAVWARVLSIEERAALTAAPFLPLRS
jgi:hypothetical protein